MTVKKGVLCSSGVMAATADSKSAVLVTYGFKSHLEHQYRSGMDGINSCRSNAFP